LAEFLERQAWPHAEMRLVLFDTSQSPGFSAHVRRWVGRCDYADARHVRATVADAGLADRLRMGAELEVGRAMARIYNWLAREVTTDFAWVLEDDVIPPLDACGRLLGAFDTNTASASGLYRSRWGGGYVVWQRNGQRYTARGQGVQEVAGNGFGCVLIRGDVLRGTEFTVSREEPGHDYVFYRRLPPGLAAKIDWSVDCEHRILDNDSMNDRR
jgi:hypothetical protein